MKHSSHQFMTEENHSLDRVTILLDTILLAYFSEVKLCLNGLVLFYHYLSEISSIFP